MTPRWLAVVVAMENLLVCLIYVSAFARITWHNRHRKPIFIGGLLTTVMFALMDLTAVLVFLREGV